MIVRGECINVCRDASFYPLAVCLVYFVVEMKDEKEMSQGLPVEISNRKRCSPPLMINVYPSLMYCFVTTHFA